MKTPRPAKAERSAPSSVNFNVVGGFPAKHSSVCAEVLARLLNYERLTSLDAVADASTTRLSAVVFYLAKKYGWIIESTDKAAGCSNGRVAWVSEYTLPADTVARAVAAGAAAWCTDVRAARRALRADAERAYRTADIANAVFKIRETRDKNWLSNGAAQ